MDIEWENQFLKRSVAKELCLVVGDLQKTTFPTPIFPFNSRSILNDLSFVSLPQGRVVDSRRLVQLRHLKSHHVINERETLF
jgi:hypothetical protein